MRIINYQKDDFVIRLRLPLNKTGGGKQYIF